MKKGKEKFTYKSDEHKEAMLKLGKFQQQKNDLEYNPFFDTLLSLFVIALTIALSILFYKYFAVSFIANRAAQIAVTAVVSIVLCFLLTFIAALTFRNLINRINKKIATKKHAEELQSLDTQIDTLVNRIIKNYGGEKDQILKISLSEYSKQIAKKNREYAKERAKERLTSYNPYSSGYLSSSSSDTSSNDSSSSSSSSDSSPSSRQSLVDANGHEIAYRDGDRVYSSDTHDLVGYMSGNQLYTYDEGRVGEFDDNGNFTQYK